MKQASVNLLFECLQLLLLAQFLHVKNQKSGHMTKNSLIHMGKISVSDDFHIG